MHVLRSYQNFTHNGHSARIWCYGQERIVVPPSVTTNILRTALLANNDNILETEARLWRSLDPLCDDAEIRRFGKDISRPRGRKSRLHDLESRKGYRVYFRWETETTGRISVSLVQGSKEDNETLLFLTGTFRVNKPAGLEQVLLAMQEYLNNVRIPTTVSFLKRLDKVSIGVVDMVALRLEMPYINQDLKKYWLTGTGDDTPGTRRCFLPISGRLTVFNEPLIYPNKETSNGQEDIGGIGEEH